MANNYQRWAARRSTEGLRAFISKHGPLIRHLTALKLTYDGNVANYQAALQAPHLCKLRAAMDELARREWLVVPT